MIEILAWAPTRAAFIAGFTTAKLPVEGMSPEEQPSLATVDEAGVLTPIAGLHIDEIGDIVKVPSKLDDNGNAMTPPVFVKGVHANLLITDPLFSFITAGLPQTDADGNLLPVFERTNILSLFPAMKATKKDDKPEGHTGRAKLRLFDPVTVTQRRRVWFGV